MSMAMTPERRVARLLVPAQIAGPRRGLHQVRLLDLSSQGACIEHFRPLSDWTMYFLELPRALGGVRLQGEVLWCRKGGRRSVMGKRLVSYQSGLTFRWLTPKQRAGLTAALEILQATQKA